MDLTPGRFCRRALDEIALLCTDTEDGLSNHERYGNVYGRLHDINHDMALAFDGASRSIALDQITVMRRLGLWTDEEVARFSEDTIRRTKPLDLDDED